MSNALARTDHCPIFLSRPSIVDEKANCRLELRGWWKPLAAAQQGNYWMAQQSVVTIFSRWSALLYLEFAVDCFATEPLALKISQGNSELLSLSEQQLSRQLGRLQRVYCSVVQGPNELLFSTSAASGSNLKLSCSGFALTPLTRDPAPQ